MERRLGRLVGANWALIIREVEAELKPGMIILFHENRGQTIRALTTLLPELHRRHLRIGQRSGAARDRSSLSTPAARRAQWV